MCFIISNQAVLKILRATQVKIKVSSNIHRHLKFFKGFENLINSWYFYNLNNFLFHCFCAILDIADPLYLNPNALFVHFFLYHLKLNIEDTKVHRSKLQLSLRSCFSVEVAIKLALSLFSAEATLKETSKWWSNFYRWCHRVVPIFFRLACISKWRNAARSELQLN